MKENAKIPLQSSVVLVGLMGSGKSSVGRRLAKSLDVEFLDIDEEIELAADRKIADIFAEFGETEFRKLETRVLERVMDQSPKVIATGGGVFVSATNREIIENKGVSVWIDADLETLWGRVSGKTHRPLLQQDNPKAVLAELLEKRNPEYAKADFRVVSKAGEPHEFVIKQICEALQLNCSHNIAEEEQK